MIFWQKSKNQNFAIFDFFKKYFFQEQFCKRLKTFFFFILKILQLSFNLLFLPLKNIYNWLIYGKMKKVGKNCSFCPYMDQITVSRTDKLEYHHVHFNLILIQNKKRSKAQNRVDVFIIWWCSFFLAKGQQKDSNSTYFLMKWTCNEIRKLNFLKKDHKNL